MKQANCPHPTDGGADWGPGAMVPAGCVCWGGAAGDQGKVLALCLADCPMGASGLPRSLSKAPLGKDEDSHHFQLKKKKLGFPADFLLSVQKGLNLFLQNFESSALCSDSPI